MDLCILVDSFDGYSDLWNPFIDVFRLKWPDCPYAVKLVSNKLIFDNDYVETIRVGEEVNWSTRTLKALNSVDSDYVLLLLEDYLLGDLVDTETIVKGLDYLKANQGKFLRLTNYPKSRYNSDEKDIFPLYADEEYAVNLQAAIWERKYFIECIKKYEGNAWEFEIGLLREAINSDHSVLSGCYGFNEDPLHIINGVLKGNWFPSAVKYCKKNGVNVDLDARKCLSLINIAQYNCKIGIKKHISYSMRRKIKTILKKCGVKFVSDF